MQISPSSVKINLIVEIMDLKFMIVLVAYFYLNVESVYKFVGSSENICVL